MQKKGQTLKSFQTVNIGSSTTKKRFYSRIPTLSSTIPIPPPPLRLWLKFAHPSAKSARPTDGRLAAGSSTSRAGQLSVLFFFRKNFARRRTHTIHAHRWRRDARASDMRVLMQLQLETTLLFANTRVCEFS